MSDEWTLEDSYNLERSLDRTTLTKHKISLLQLKIMALEKENTLLWERVKELEQAQQWEAMTDQLKPCPFCGGAAILKSISNIHALSADDWWVSCKNCHIERPSTKKTEIAGSREQAIASWNRRTPAGSQQWQPVEDFYKGGQLTTWDEGDENGVSAWWISIGAIGAPLPDNIRLCRRTEK